MLKYKIPQIVTLTPYCSTKGGREPHFFAFLGKIKNTDFR